MGFERKLPPQDREHPPIFRNNSLTIFYRDNKVFPTIVEEIKRDAEAMGASVSIHVFPAALNEEGIESEYRSMENKPEGDIIADATFQGATG